MGQNILVFLCGPPCIGKCLGLGPMKGQNTLTWLCGSPLRGKCLGLGPKTGQNTFLLSLWATLYREVSGSRTHDGPEHIDLA